MANLRIGTCRWKYDSWIGLVYPDAVKIDYLKEYSKLYNTVEIDQWFWSLGSTAKAGLPNTALAAEYAESVTEDFKFSIKVPNSLTLTHYYNKGKKSHLEPNPFFLSPELFKVFLNQFTH